MTDNHELYAMILGHVAEAREKVAEADNHPDRPLGAIMVAIDQLAEAILILAEHLRTSDQ